MNDLLRRLVAFLERELFLVLMLATYVGILAALAPYELHQDSWLALVAGRDVFSHGPPAHDSLAVLTHGRTWIDQQWLAQLLLYGAFSTGGMRGRVLPPPLLF